MTRSKKTVLKFLPVIAAVFTFILTEFAASFPASTEKFYSNGIYPVIASALSPVSSIFPFSLDDIFYVALVLFFIVLTVLLLIKKVPLKKYLVLLPNTIALVYLSFYWLWGFNYYREGLTKRLDIREQKADEEDFRNALDQIITSVNKNYPDTFDLSKEKINSEIETSYSDLSNILRINYPQGIRRPKPITFSSLFAKATISGYFGPFFNEIHINKYLLPVEYPWTLAHEKSHQFGITSEAEANFYAWMVCNNSTDSRIRYAGNLNLLFYFLYEAKKLPDYKEIIEKTDPGVKNDINRIIRHWNKLRNANIEKVAAKANDTYLKTNKVERGIDDYDGVVKFVTEYLQAKNTAEQ
jgi:hypothetical protein